MHYDWRAAAAPRRRCRACPQAG